MTISTQTEIFRSSAAKKNFVKQFYNILTSHALHHARRRDYCDLADEFIADEEVIYPPFRKFKSADELLQYL